MRRLVPLLALATVTAACSGGVAATTTSSSSTSSSTTVATTTTTSSTTSTSVPETTTTTIDFSQFTSTTEYRPVEPEYVLLLDGFGSFGVLGDDAETVVGAFIAEFGEPTADSDWLGADDHGCSFDGPMRTVTWIEPGVRLTFVDGETAVGDGAHLAHYTTVLPIDPPWELDGVRREMDLDAVLELFPDAEIVEASPLDLIRFEPDVDSFASVDAAGQIREFTAGVDFCG